MEFIRVLFRSCLLPLFGLCLAIQPQRTGKNPPNFLARIERCIGVLKNELQSTPIVGPHLVRVSIDLAVEPDFTPERHQAEQGLGQCRLARTRLSDHTQYLEFPDVKIQGLQRRRQRSESAQNRIEQRLPAIVQAEERKSTRLNASH